MVRIKICGITNLEDAKLALELGADALGFVFAKSPRRIKPQDAAKIINELPHRFNFVAVFVNAPRKSVEKIVHICKIKTLQFHGDEMPKYCALFRKKYKVIKAFRIKDKNSLNALRLYDVDGYLLDTDGRLRGGSGKTFDWRLAQKAKKMVSPIILSGGLNPANVADAIKMVRPYAVDVSSGIESKPGKKDIKLMRRFIMAVKDEDISR